jgi:hypothetical protein
MRLAIAIRLSDACCSGGRERTARHCRRGTGKIWLMTIDEESWKPASGERVAKIGPLPFHTRRKVFRADGVIRKLHIPNAMCGNQEG